MLTDVFSSDDRAGDGMVWGGEYEGRHPAAMSHEIYDQNFFCQVTWSVCYMSAFWLRQNKKK